MRAHNIDYFNEVLQHFSLQQGPKRHPLQDRSPEAAFSAYKAATSRNSSNSDVHKDSRRLPSSKRSESPNNLAKRKNHTRKRHPPSPPYEGALQSFPSHFFLLFRSSQNNQTKVTFSNFFLALSPYVIFSSLYVRKHKSNSQQNPHRITKRNITSVPFFLFSLPYLENINLILNRIPVESPSKSKSKNFNRMVRLFFTNQKTVKLLTIQTVKNGQR
jgi:hypothetical protein